MKSHLFLFLSLICFGSVSAQEILVTVKGKRIPGNLGTSSPDKIGFMTESKELISVEHKKIAYLLGEKGNRMWLTPTIHLYNGRNIQAENIRQDGKFLRYARPGKSKEFKVRTDKVFSYHTRDEEVVLFKESIFNGDTLSEKNIRSMVEGRQDARLFYKNPYTGIVNFTLGFAAGGLLNYWGILIPATYTGVYSAINPLKSKRKERILGPRYLTDDYYRYGFNGRAKISKVKWSAGGGLLGIITSVGILEYLKKYEPELIDKIW